MSKIGIAITTYKRQEIFETTLAQIKKFAPKNALIVIVDDGNETPHPETTYHFKENQGISVAKNKCLELLYEAGCEHFFLFDNDCYPKKKGWEKPYIKSKEPHLCYTFPNKAECIIKTEGGLNVFNAANGCMLYFERRVLDKIGGFDTRFKIYGGEHRSLSRRIFHAGLTSHKYMDVANSSALIHSMDAYKEVAPTLENANHYLNKNRAIRISTYRSRDFHPFMNLKIPKEKKTIDVLYILGTGSIHNNEELRYSLRSLGAHGKNIGQVIVVGEDPGFLSENVEFYPLGESGNREYRIASKVLWASVNVLSGDFLFMNDDVFFNKPFDFKEYDGVGYYIADLAANRDLHRSYKQSCLNTAAYLKSKGLSTKNFDHHAPTIYNAERFAALLPHWEYSKNLTYGMVVKSVYFNLYRNTGKPYTDVKLNSLRTEKDFERLKLNGSFSCSDAGWRGGVGSYLKKLYPNPSKYEI